MKRKVQDISTSTNLPETEIIESGIGNNDTSTKSKNRDVYSRVLTSSKKGRGSESGWTTCPLCNSSNKNNSTIDRNCNSKSQKKFSLGRGISMHLNQG